MLTFMLSKKNLLLMLVSICLGSVFVSSIATANDDVKKPVPAAHESKKSSQTKYEANLLKKTEEENEEYDELSLEAFMNVGGNNNNSSDPAQLFDEQAQEAATLSIRRDSQKEAALSYGARGGLHWRTKQISDKLEKQSTALDRSFNFRRLLIKAPTNLLIEPPIIREAIDALLVNPTGQEAAVADAIYNISKNANIVTSARTWRDYLYRELAENSLTPPPTVLLPETSQERVLWKKWVEVGWYQGIKQADAVFESDVQRLVADYQGMVRYRILLAEGKVSPPFAVLEDRGITGGGSEMRVGDRAIRITGPSKLKASMGGQTWTPGIQ